MNQILRVFYTPRGPYSGFRATICPAPQLFTIFGKELNNHISITLSITFGIPFFQIGGSFQVIPVDSCKSGLTWESRDSSVGRALDWRSKGPRFDPGSRQFYLELHLSDSRSKGPQFNPRLWQSNNVVSFYFALWLKKSWGTTEIRTRDLLFTRQAL